MEDLILKYREMLLSQSYERHKGSLLPRYLNEKNFIRDEDGSLYFGDIDYSNHDRAIWQPYSHLARIEHIILSGNAEFRPMCVDFLRFWLKNDFICPNWWYNEIGTPMLLADIAILMYGELDQSLEKIMNERLYRGVVDESTNRNRGVYTGANLLWFASTTMVYSMLTGNEKTLRFITELAARETLEGREGLQSDNSFFQHGRRLYSAGYGRSFITSIVPMLHLLDGTEYSFPKYAFDNLARHIIDGLRFMMHRGYYDYVSVGREYVRKNSLCARGLIRSAKLLCSLQGFERREELSLLLESIEKKQPAFEGVKYFPVAALLTMQLDGVYFSYKGTTPEIWDAENINDENRLGYNLSYGTHTTVMQSGEEYNDVSPLWDYSAIPGTTAPCMTDSELLSLPDFSKRYVHTDDFGGWCDGDVGAIYLTTNHEGISVVSCAFATPYGLVLLGNSIKDSEGRELITTAEQCLALYDVEKVGDGIRFGNVVYRSLDDKAPLLYNVTEKCGNWHRNRPSEPDSPINGKVFTVRVAREGGYDKYAYVISPASVDTSGLRVLKNDGTEQIISLPDGRVLSARK